MAVIVLQMIRSVLSPRSYCGNYIDLSVSLIAFNQTHLFKVQNGVIASNVNFLMLQPPCCTADEDICSLDGICKDCTTVSFSLSQQYLE